MLRGAQEIIEWLANPDAFQADALPKFVEEYDAVPYLLSAVPIAAGVMGVQLAHELAHRAVAARKQVRALWCVSSLGLRCRRFGQHAA